MNRLFLIGNGFDLAHGLKTSYNDFIVWYIKKCYAQAFNHGIYKDDLMEVKRNGQYIGEILSYEADVIRYVEACYKEGFTGLGQYIPVMGNSYANQYPFHANMSSLIKALLENCSSSRWVDVESTFYHHLREILKATSTGEKEIKLKELNGSLKFLIQQLEEYLMTLPVPRYEEGYKRIFNSIINKDVIHFKGTDQLMTGFKRSEPPKHTHILDFNYTNTVGKYFDKSLLDHSKAFQINYIHGRIGDKSNRLVFGFGDELDDDYLRMERENIRGYFEHIKSFWYFKTNNYSELIRFIDSDAYQVCILGHSCGLSDRTMLHMIFEHTNCKSILIYYHKDKEGNTNYTDITQDISRHFKSKEEMRNKIVSEPNCSEMPQIVN